MKDKLSNTAFLIKKILPFRCFEIEQVKEALTWAMVDVTKEAEERWNYTFALPLEIEISGGKNWLDQVEYD